MKRVRRAFLLALFLTFVVAVGLMFITAAQLSGTTGPTTVAVEPFGLTIWEAERTVQRDTSSVALTPGPGLFVLVLGIPALVAGLVALRGRRRNAGRHAAALG